MAESDLIRGNVDTLILKVLYDGDRYGYDLIKQINAKSGGQWEIKQPTLYACLKRLEKQEFVKSYWDGSESGGGRRKYYTLTESGREVFLKYKGEFDRTRDLFGSLISDEDTYLPVYDFSDVEEESYSVPKRRPRSAQKPRKKQVASNDEAQPNITGDEYPNSYFDYAQPITVSADVTEQKPKDNAESPEESPIQTHDDTEEFVQQSFFDNLAQSSREEEVAEEEVDDELMLVSEPVVTNRHDSVMPNVADPKEIMDMLSSSYTGSESYSSARANAPLQTTEYPERKESPAAPPAPIATSSVPAEREERLPVGEDEESLASRAYKDILSDLIERCDTAVSRAPAEQAAAVNMSEDETESHRFGSVIKNVEELGNDVTVRDHNDSAKVYTRKYYYYSNRLFMTHYMTMCAVMFILGLTLFLTFYAGLNMRLEYDYLLYIFAGLLPIIMFITAVVVFVTEPDKRKRINVNFRSSIIIRLVIMVQTFVIIYAVNLMFKMPTGFSLEYLPSLLIPIVYALFIPLSEVIFMTLLNSGRYAVE